MAQKAPRKLLLSLSVAAALGCVWSGSVFADGDDVAALEARIAELENLVHQLMQAQPAPTSSSADVEAKAEAAAEAKVVAMLDEHEQATAEEVHKHSYKFGGYIKTDIIYSDYSSGSYSGAGRDFYIPGTIPVGSGNGESYTDFHAKESRINFKSTHNLDNGAKLGTFFEMDFHLPSQGDERISNSYSPRIRHAFVTYNKWLIGQTWMTFFNVGALPENLDFVGPAESTIFGRQAMVRYTSGPWQFALENPETTVTPYGGGGRIVTDDNLAPDVVLRYNTKGDWGTFTVAGTFRQLSYDNNANIDDSTTGYGISLSGKFVLGNKDDFRWMVSTGSGMGRYMGLNTANGAVLDQYGRLHAIDSTGVFGSYRHLWNDKWRSNLTLGYLSVDNDTSLTGMGVTKNASSMHFNVIYSPQPKLDFGVELLLANREIESGADGDMTRLQFSAKYAY
ncbi:MAG: DcaP family trimeric outer membrane transporter [Xanthomonadales bacterium]|nr:DcaP family trimeric outer membrane transporter [Xanthomonadales bacterium]